jgi:hypothetical protein
VDIANTVVAVYGVARLAHVVGSAGVHFTTDLRNRWQALKESKHFARLEAEAASKSMIAEMDRAIESLPAPPETLGQRMINGLDEWAEQPAGGMGALGAKEADELLKAGWRKLRKTKPRPAAKPRPGASVPAPPKPVTATAPKVRTPKSPKPVKPPKSATPAEPATPRGFRAREEAARVVTGRGTSMEAQAMEEPGMHVEVVPNRTSGRRPAASASESGGVPLSERVHVGDLENGLPTGVVGELTPADLHTGTSTSDDVSPVGQQPEGAGRYGARKGHLLGEVMGGSGRDLGNLAWMHKWVNNSTFKKLFENAVIKALKSGKSVRFGVRPKFRGSEVAPYEIEVWATTGSGEVLVPVRNIRTPGLEDLSRPPAE